MSNKKIVNNKYLLVFLVISMLFLTSCSNSEKKSNDNSEKQIISNDYLENVNPKIITPDLEELYKSSPGTPSEEDVTRIKETIYKDISTFGAAKIRTVFFDMIEYQKLWLQQYTPGSESYFWNSLSVQPVNLEDMINNLESVKEYVSNEDVKFDISSVQTLLAYSLNSQNVDGLFYAHHILSDLNYWGFSHGIDTTEFLSWEVPYEIKEISLYYAVSKTCGEEYPDVINEIVENPENTYVVNDNLYPLKEMIAQGDANISETTSSLSSDEVKTIAKNLDEIINGEIKSDSEKLLKELDNCISIVENTPAKTDIETLKKFISLYIEPGDFDSHIKTSCLVSAIRISRELEQIVFYNDNAVNYNSYYYGYLKMLEGDVPSAKQYEYLTGEITIQVEDIEGSGGNREIDFFNMDY